MKLSAFLWESYPGLRGVSIHSWERFCSVKGIHKSSRLGKPQLAEAVSDAITKVYISIHVVDELLILCTYIYRWDQLMAVRP